MYFKKNILFVMICWAIFSAFISSNFAHATGDRVLVHIQKSAFSQRRLEAYIYVKRAIETKGQTIEIGQKNWTELSDEFLNDMLIEIESMRLGGFRPAISAMTLANDNYEKRVAESQHLRDRMASLEVSHAELQQIITTILRVEAYKVSKGVLTELKKSEIVFVSNEATLKSEWFAKLKSQASVRWFANSDKYIAIAPVGR
jgi:hypothetical protein